MEETFHLTDTPEGFQQWLRAYFAPTFAINPGGDSSNWHASGRDCFVEVTGFRAWLMMGCPYGITIRDWQVAWRWEKRMECCWAPLSPTRLRVRLWLLGTSLERGFGDDATRRSQSIFAGLRAALLQSSEAIQGVPQGKTQPGPDGQEALAEREQGPTDSEDALSGIPEGDQGLVRLWREGRTSSKIAAEMDYTEQYVRNRLSNLRKSHGQEKVPYRRKGAGR